MADDMFKPKPFTKKTVTTIINELKEKVTDHFKHPLRMVDVDTWSMEWKGNKLQVEVIVYINGQVKATKLFTFISHDEYWEESDYEEHINRTIINFINTL